MKFRKDKNIIIFIGISLSAVLAGVIISLFTKDISIVGFLLILGGFMGLGIGLTAATKPRCDLIEDERSVRIREKAGYSAFIALMGPVFAIASVIYVLSFYRYEKGVNENEN